MERSSTQQHPAEFPAAARLFFPAASCRISSGVGLKISEEQRAEFPEALGCAVTPQRCSQLLQGAACSQVHAGDPALSASQPLIKTTREAFPSPSLLSKSCPWPWHHLLAAAPQFLGFWQGSPREYPGEGKRRARCGDNTAGRALKKPQEPLGALPWLVSPPTSPPCWR